MRAYDVVLIVLVALISGVRYTEQLDLVFDWDRVVYENGTISYVDEDETLTESDSSLAELRENVDFILYRRNTTNCTLYPGDDVSFEACNVDVSLPTRFVIHGWKNLESSSMCVDTTKALLVEGNYNVIVVDWDTWASENYIAARLKVAPVGQYVALEINDLELRGVNLSDVIVIGHSLGAHIAGVACRNATGTIAILEALDPAGPLFYGTEMNARMTSTDAACVEVIHTSAGGLGYSESLGKYDHWPNGGSSQPDCGWDLLDTCSHGRAYEYYVEVLLTGNFSSTFCSSYSNYTAEDCADNVKTHMGLTCGKALLENITVTGNFYLETSGTSPYCLD